jgi:hypothetical protein
MTLINVPASFPTPMWAVARFLLSVGGRHPAERAKAMLSPPSLLPDEDAGAKDETFSQAIKSLQELGLVLAEGDQLRLAPNVQKLSPVDIGGFTDLLCRAVLAPHRNADLSESDDQGGPKDLVRALAWFLTCDPFTPLGLEQVTQLQKGAFPSHLGNPIVNDVRWNRFVYWAPTLGFASQPLLDNGRQGQQLVPDCTAAVRRTVLAAWEKGQRINAADAIDRIITELPVLPGGRYSQSLGLRSPSTEVAATLSFALLCGHDHGWISLGRRSDATRDVFLADPDNANGTRRISEVIITGSINE